MEEVSEIWEEAKKEAFNFKDEAVENPDRYPTSLTVTGVELLTRISDFEFFKHVTEYGVDKFFHFEAGHSGVRVLNDVQEKAPDYIIDKTFARTDPVSNLSCYMGLKTRDPSFRRKTAVSSGLVYAALTFKETQDAFFSNYDMFANTVGVTTGSYMTYQLEKNGYNNPVEVFTDNIWREEDRLESSD